MAGARRGGRLAADPSGLPLHSGPNGGRHGNPPRGPEVRTVDTRPHAGKPLGGGRLELVACRRRAAGGRLAGLIVLEGWTGLAALPLVLVWVALVAVVFARRER
jgi:hypothetical protein